MKRVVDSSSVNIKDMEEEKVHERGSVKKDQMKQSDSAANSTSKIFDSAHSTLSQKVGYQPLTSTDSHCLLE